jgi:hypothetical protein
MGVGSGVAAACGSPTWVSATWGVGVVGAGSAAAGASTTVSAMAGTPMSMTR